jgi:hypothetical protein
MALLEKHYSLCEADAINRGIFDDDTHLDELRNLIIIIDWLSDSEGSIPKEVYDVMVEYVENFATE